MLSNFFAKVSILKESSYGFSKNTEFHIYPTQQVPDLSVFIYKNQHIVAGIDFFSLFM